MKRNGTERIEIRIVSVWNGTEQNGTERNGTERIKIENETERNGTE